MGLGFKFNPFYFFRLICINWCSHLVLSLSWWCYEWRIRFCAINSCFLHFILSLEIENAYKLCEICYYFRLFSKCKMSILLLMCCSITLIPSQVSGMPMTTPDYAVVFFKNFRFRSTQGYRVDSHDPCHYLSDCLLHCNAWPSVTSFCNVIFDLDTNFYSADSWLLCHPFLIFILWWILVGHFRLMNSIYHSNNENLPLAKSAGKYMV